MSQRLKNNLIAGLIVVGFWLVIVIPTIVQAADPIVTESTQTIISKGDQTTTVKSPPPSAISSQITSSSSDFLCTVSASGALQTQVLGISLGGMYSDSLCELMQRSHALWNMGMKVAAVSQLCQDPQIFEAMRQAGSHCPYEGKLGSDAKRLWEAHTDKIPKEINETNKKEKTDNYLKLVGGIVAAFLFF
tara:strand:- start:6275 stop:6844 length:570 start_codon:yes stop_codon:yes gene_type:complete